MLLKRERDRNQTIDGNLQFSRQTAIDEERRGSSAFIEIFGFFFLIISVHFV